MTTTNNKLKRILKDLDINYEYVETDNAFLASFGIQGESFDVAIVVDIKGNNVLLRTLDMYKVVRDRAAVLEFVAKYNFQTKLIKVGLAPDDELVAMIDVFVGTEKLTKDLFNLAMSIFLELLVHLNQEIKLLEVAHMTPVVRA